MAAAIIAVSGHGRGLLGRVGEAGILLYTEQCSESHSYKVPKMTHVQSHPSPAEEEISLSALLQQVRAWVSQYYCSLRFYLAILLIIFLIFFALVILLIPPKYSYSETISFSFPQAEKGKYPNNANFTFNDLTSRLVLEEVWENNDLQNQGISFEAFVSAVSITPFANNEDFIRARYQSLVSKKGLSVSEINEIEKSYGMELESQSRKTARLTLIVPFYSPLSNDLANKVLTDIPKEWSRQAIENMGVVSIPIAEKESVKDNILKKGSPFQIVDYFYKTSDKLNSALKVISSFPGGETLRDTKTGLNIEDLKNKLTDLNRYWIIDLDNYIQQRNPATELDILSAETRLREMKDKQQEYYAMANVYKQSLLDYDESKLPNLLKNRENAAPMSNLPTSPVVQVQGDAVQKLIELGSKNSDSVFRQGLVQKRVDAELAAAAMTEEITRLERRIQSAKNPPPAVAQNDAEKLDSYTTEIWNQLSTIAESIQRIQAQQTVRFTNDSSQLYTASPVQKRFSSSKTVYVVIPLTVFMLIILSMKLVKLFVYKQRKLSI